MSVSVVFAWHDNGDVYRQRSFNIVRRHMLDALPFAEQIVSSPSPFTSRASALNIGIERAGGSVIVHCDPDSLLPARRIQEAVKLAAAADGQVVPFDSYLYLSRKATDWAHDQYGWPSFELERLGPSLCDDHGPGGVGNITVYSMATWRAAGGYDERFGVWAGDDGAFSMAAHYLSAPVRRLNGPVWHLWHERHPDSIPGAPGYTAQQAVLNEYLAANTAEKMRTLVNSVRAEQQSR